MIELEKLQVRFLREVPLQKLISGETYYLGYFSNAPQKAYLVGNFLSYNGDIAKFNRMSFMPPDYYYEAHYNKNHYSFWKYCRVEYFMRKAEKRISLIKRELMEKIWAPTLTFDKNNIA